MSKISERILCLIPHESKKTYKITINAEFEGEIISCSLNLLPLTEEQYEKIKNGGIEVNVNISEVKL